MEEISRRGFVRLLGGVLSAGVVPCNFAGCGGGLVRNSDFNPTPQRPLTPVDRFYVNYNFGVPANLPQPSEWRLHLRGLFERPLELGWDDLMRFPAVESDVTLECIGNIPAGGLISSARFTGVRLRDVLAAAQLSAHAFGLQLLGLDGYPVFLPVDAGLAEEALLVHAMNGEPLRAIHGAPLRALFPGRFGMFSIKWLDSITATRQQGTWSALRSLASFVDGQTRTRSQIRAPYLGSVAQVGEETTLSGLAATPGIGIASVEVRVDDEWRQAELTYNQVATRDSRYLWTLWRYRWTPQRAGRHVLAVRAVDNNGGSQMEQAGFPYDSSSIHFVPIVVRG